MSDKVKNYYESFLKTAIKSKEQLDNFIKTDDVKKKFSSKEIGSLVDLWSGKNIVEAVEEVVEEVYKDASDLLDPFTKKDYKFKNNKKK